MAHTCHALRCKTECHPTLLMCPSHWAMVPKDLQRAVYASYRSGQCKDGQPSWEWHRAADNAIAAVAEQEGCPKEIADHIRATADRGQAWLKANGYAA